MTLKDDAQAAFAAIIYGGFSSVATHKISGVSQSTFNCLVGEAILHGNEETGVINAENIHITVVTSDVAAVKIRQTINVNSLDYQVVNNPYADSEFSGASVIELRRERLNETKI